jgi:hypothetical protein
VTEWLQTAAERASSLALRLTGSGQDVQAGTRSKGFPILAPDK